MYELLPCPYCGGVDLKDPIDEWLSDADSHWVSCYDCGCCGPCAERSEDACDKWNALPRALRWTKEPPTTPGWYWWKEKPGKRPRIVDVQPGQYSGTNIFFTLIPQGICKVKEMDGEWAGPISEPKEK